MKSFNLGLLLGIFFFITSVFAYAQEQSDIDEIVLDMQQELALTPQQVNAIKPIIAQRLARQQVALIQSTQKGSILVRSKVNQQLPNPEVASTPQGDLDKEEQEQLSQILTQEQMGKWDSIQSQLLKEQRKRMEKAMRTGEKPAL